MSKKTVFCIASVLSVALMSGSIAIAGSEPASPNPVFVPTPVRTPTDTPPAITPQNVQAAQALFAAVLTNPPPTISVALQVQILSLLNQISLQPDLAEALGLSDAQLAELIDSIQAIPTSPS